MLIWKSYRFEAAHFLPGVPPTHKCSKNHGHSYKIRVAVFGKPDPKTGFVMDYGDISEVVKRLVVNRLDHTTLNDIIKNPTAELLAIWIWNRLKQEIPNLEQVEVQETDTSGALYSGETYDHPELLTGEFTA